MMRKCGLYYVTFLTMVVLGGCTAYDNFMAPPGQVTTYGGPSIAQAQAEYYNGPRARIAVVVKPGPGITAVRASGRTISVRDLTDGLSSMITTSLFNTNRYVVLEREILDEVLAEQDLGASGRVSQQTAAPIGQVEGAELLLTAKLTMFAPGTAGASAGITGVNTPINVGGLFRKSRVGMDLRIIDARTSRVVAATSVEGQARDIGGAIGGIVGGGSSRLGLGLSGFSNTPIEKAIRNCINSAVNFFVMQTPPTYYHYAPDGTPVKVE